MPNLCIPHTDNADIETETKRWKRREKKEEIEREKRWKRRKRETEKKYHEKELEEQILIVARFYAILLGLGGSISPKIMIC